MKKTFYYGLKALQLSWEANGVHAVSSIASQIYSNSIYPFIQILLLSQFLDLLGRQKGITFGDISWLIISYSLATVVKIIWLSYYDIKQVFYDFRFESYLDLQISRKLASLDPATFEKPSFQDLIVQVDGAKNVIQAHLIKLTNLLDQIFKFIMAAVVVSSIYPIFIPIIVLATVPSYLMWDKLRILTWSFYIEKRSLMVRITQYIKNLLSSDATSKEAAIFQTGPILISKITNHQHKYYKDMNKALNPRIVEITLARILQFGAFAYTQYLILNKVLNGAIGIGQFTLFFQQALNLTFSAEEILNQYSSLAARNKYLDKYYEILNTENTIPLPKKPLPIPQTAMPPVIEFKNVSFKYPETDRFILKHFNLTIKSGEKIALVGENGAGKSTLIKLLLRFHDATEGVVLVNGTNIKEIDLVEWHKLVGALFQDFIKYQFSFKENVYYGDITKPEDMSLLLEAIQKSGADKYLDDLPDKHNQVVGKMFEGGIDLSGGQWQKLALARAFFRNSPILILDEPTSAIDAKAEYEIFEKVQKLQKDKTVIIISHRFSTVRNADRILVLDQGRIIEDGNHEKLMKKKGLYAELFNIQAQGYK